MLCMHAAVALGVVVVEGMFGCATLCGRRGGCPPRRHNGSLGHPRAPGSSQAAPQKSVWRGSTREGEHLCLSPPISPVLPNPHRHPLLQAASRIAATDITSHAVAQLEASGVEEVHLIGRRGPVQVGRAGWWWWWGVSGMGLREGVVRYCVSWEG